MINNDMNDKQIIEGLIARDNWITYQYFFVKSRPLLTSILKMVFGKHFTYDEMVNELYFYLMEDDCRRLRKYEFQSSVYQWMKVVALRYFLQKRARLIEKESEDYPNDRGSDRETVDTESAINARMDVRRLLELMDNQRYATVIRHLILEDMEPKLCAAMMGVTVDNLYNIKKHALTALAKVAIKFYSYGK